MARPGLAASLRRLACDERGATAVLTALVLAAILGFLALGIEAALGLLAQRRLQEAADSAARAGALALRAGPHPPAAAEARAVAEGLLPEAAREARVLVHHPPASGAHRGDPAAVEVRIDAARAPLLAGFLGGSGGRLAARAVARLVTVGEGCILALLPRSADSVRLIRPSDLLLSDCGILSAGGGVPALRLEEADPYRGRALEPPAGCTATGLVVSGTLVVPPGRPAVFCNGLTVAAGGRVTLGAGLHVVDGGTLAVLPGGTLVSEGATILLTGRGGRRPAVTNVQPGAVVRLRAPETGEGAGLALLSDRPSLTTHFLTSPALSLIGAVRLPGSTLLFAGNPTGGCAQLIADRIVIAGPSRLTAGGCAGTGMVPLLDRVARLAE